MKTIKVRKDRIFSSRSKVFIFIGSKRIHIKGFELYAITLNQQDSIYASQLWTKSKVIKYDDVIDGATIVIRPFFGRAFTLFTLALFLVCAAVFYIWRSRWSFIPFGILGIYIIVFMTCLADRYLILDQNEGEEMLKNP